MTVPVVSSLPILGVTIQHDGSPYALQAERDRIARATLHAAHHIWNNKFLSLADRLRFYFEQKLPCYLYGSETWPINTTALKQVELFHNHCLRTAVANRWNPEKQEYEEWIKHVTNVGAKCYNATHKHPIILYLRKVVTHLQAAYSSSIANAHIKLFQ